MALPFAAMETIKRRVTNPTAVAVAAAIAAATLLLGPAAPAAAADEGTAGAAVTLAVGDHERRPIAPTQRDQLGLVLYGFMALATVAGIATMRRQLKGERPQTDGEFRWR